MRRILAALLLAASAAFTIAALAGGATSPTPYERAQALDQHVTALIPKAQAVVTELQTAKTEADALETALKPASEPPPAKEQTTWAPASSTQVPLADVQAAACVTHKTDIHSDNTSFNAYVPTTAELEAFHKTAAGFSPLSKYVDGLDGLAGPSTDDLIQWAACKWGIPADWLRAEYVVESNWHQLECAGNVACSSTGGPAGAGLAGRGFGDCAPSGNGPSSAIGAAGCSGVYTSIGITQVKEQSCCHPGTYPLAWKSTAFNIDYQAGILRYYFDGLCGWCSYGYKGQEWPAIGAWFSPGSNDSGAVDYQGKVKAVLAERTWTKGGF